MGHETLAEKAVGDGEEYDVVHARILRFFPDLVEALGGDPVKLLHQAGIAADWVSEGEPTVTYRQAIQAIELAAAALMCPDFGMRLATLQRVGMFGPLGSVMKNARTFGEAIEYVGRHTYAHSLAARIRLKRSRTDGTLFCGHDIVLDGVPNRSQVTEQVLLLGHLSAMEITGGHARVRKVLFRHQPISPPKTYRRNFGCEVCFGENENGVVFSERDLAAPIIDPDARTFEETTSFIEAEFTRQSPPLHAQARGVIMQFLGTEHCTNDRVASELNLHPRTLHRRLKAEGTSFQRVKDEVRRDAMLYYLEQTSLDLAHISERLGFAEQSVMTRRCNLWFSASPTKVRSQTRRLAPAG